MKYKNRLLIPLLLVLLLAITSFSIRDVSAGTDTTRPAVLLFIGDGMGEAHRTAARWFSVGQGGQLNMDTLSYTSWTMTDNILGMVTDSAAAATAMATGEKTLNGRISRGILGRNLPTILEYVQDMGMSVGLVTNVQMSQATPAAFASHVLSRDQFTDIAEQFIEHKVNVLLAGGEDHFWPDDEMGHYPEFGDRTDGRNLTAEAVAAGYTYVWTAAGLAGVDLENTTHLLGLFADDRMPRPYDPSLEDMTEAAITILSQDPDGFFLMVEGDQIDRAAHNNDAENVINDVVGFDQAVQLGLNYQAINPCALIIVTADHETGGMSVSTESSGEPDEDGPFDIAGGGNFYVNWSTGGHTGADVPTTAQGYLASRLTGTYENTHFFDVMHSVFNWEIFLPLVLK